MTDRHVDDLLADLDRALAVEPSPSVAARVRTALAGETGAGWFGLHWRGVAATAAALLVVGVVVLTRVSDLSGPAPAAIPAPRVSVPPPAVALRAEPGPAVSIPAGRSANPEPEVIVSPNQRLALEQLAAAIREGRITADSFPAEDEPTPLDVVTITPIVPDVVRLQPWNHRPEIVF